MGGFKTGETYTLRKVIPRIPVSKSLFSSFVSQGILIGGGILVILGRYHIGGDWAL